MLMKLVVWTNGQWIQYHVWLTVFRNIPTSCGGIVFMHWHHPKFVHAVSFFAPFGVDGLTYVFFARDGELGTAAHRRNECAAARAIAAVRQLRLLHIATQCICGSKCCVFLLFCILFCKCIQLCPLVVTKSWWIIFRNVSALHYLKSGFSRSR